MTVGVFIALLMLAQPASQSFVEGTDALAYGIGKKLRCPVCQGMPIAESPSPMAQAMMKQVRAMVNEGKSPAQIEDFFVARYGEWVLLAPSTTGFNALVWVLPPLVLLLGAAWLWSRARAPRGNIARVDDAADPLVKVIRDEVHRGL